MTDLEDYKEGRTGVHTVSAFHTRLKPRPAEAFLALRALAVSLGPDVVERVTDGSVCYLRRDKPFLTVQTAKSRLHLAFPPRIPLDDPSGRLLKRGEDRYIAVEGPEHIDAHVSEFIRKSYTAVRGN